MESHYVITYACLRLGISFYISARAKQFSPHNWQLSKSQNACFFQRPLIFCGLRAENSPNNKNKYFATWDKELDTGNVETQT